MLDPKIRVSYPKDLALSREQESIVVLALEQAGNVNGLDGALFEVGVLKRQEIRSYTVDKLSCHGFIHILRSMGLNAERIK